MSAVTDSGFSEERGAGYLLDEHGHDEYSFEALHIAATSTSVEGLRIVLAGFLLPAGEVQYIAEEQRLGESGHLRLANTIVEDGLVEMPSGLAAVRRMEAVLSALAAGEEFPVLPD